MATPDAVRDAPPEGPAPKQRQTAGTYSGRLLLRMPRTLHEELAKASERDGVSLNQFITGVLESAVDWRNENAQALRLAQIEGAELSELERSELMTLRAADVLAGARALGEEPAGEEEQRRFWRRRIS